MSRARNIKPGFFKNELLVELPFEYRLLFIGLWTMADRDGRFEDRPTKLRMELFPADSVDVNAGLQALHDNGFILRYQIDGKRFCQVLAWSKHQNPHIKEGASSIPAPDKHGASTVQAPYEHGSCPADSSPLIPDTGYQRERETPASTPAGDAGRTLRAAGCSTLNLTNPDFLAALDEGVTPDEFGAAANEASDRGIGPGARFAYAVKVARTNHAKAATVVNLPSARAGPSYGAAPQSKTQLASRNIWDTVNAITERNTELDPAGDRLGLGQAPVAQLGRAPRS
ncbi:MAG: hypothetical protein AAGC76_09570 [Luteibacter sp.]|uniref:hypothetical protein n=1 Tax=Luteibacter sp. TaxID=1886636 RepID=UPI00280A0B62|nr:hypothetical protein [Luteibacter sp.]MDQ7996089.1 hypothetical protein [Luteibacter sp.]